MISRSALAIFGAMTLSSCDAIPQLGQSNLIARCVATASQSLPRMAIEMGDDPEYVREQATSAAVRQQIQDQCDCTSRILARDDFEFVIEASEMSNRLAGEGLPPDVVQYRMEAHITEAAGGDASAGRARAERIGRLVMEHCSPSQPP